jgi:hypothetical protein
MKLKIEFVAILLSVASLLPASVAGQSNNWTSVRATPRGIEVIIERKQDDRVIGIVQAITEDSIAVTSDDGSFIIERGNVTKIFHSVPRDKMKSLNRGALYGMLIGLGAGIALATAYPPENEEMPWVGTFFAGGGIGAWTGSRHARGKNKGPLIYSAK